MSGNEKVVKIDHGITVVEDGVDVMFDEPIDSGSSIDANFDEDVGEVKSAADTAADTAAAAQSVESVVLPPLPADEAPTPPPVDVTQTPEFLTLREEVNALTAQRETEAQQRAHEEAVRQRVAGINTQLAEKQAQLATAIDKGEVQAQTALLMDIQGLQLDLRLANIAATQPPTVAKSSEQRQAQQQPKQPPQPDKLTVNWVKRNPWFQRPGYEKYTRYAAYLDKEMTEDKVPLDTKYFEKLDELMQQRFPELKPKVATPPAGAAAVPPVASAARAPAATAAPGVAPKSYRLTKSDLETMEQLGLNTRNPQHLKRYAAEMAAASMTSTNLQEQQ